MKHHSHSPRIGAQYIRSLLSYLVVLAIPLVLLISFYSFRFLSKYYDEVYETVDLELQQISSNFEYQLSTMESILGQLSLSGSLQQITDSATVLDLEPMIQYLSIFTSTNPFFADVILVLDHIPYVVTSSTTSEETYFFKTLLRLEGVSPSELQQSFRRPDRSFQSNAFLQNRSLNNRTEAGSLFMFPIFSDYNKRLGSLVFHIKEANLAQLIGQRLESYQARVSIATSDGHVLFSQGPELDPQTKQLTRSYCSGRWVYTAVIPDSLATFAQVRTLIREFILIILVILIISGVLIAILQRINYRPMHLLNVRARQLNPAAEGRDELNNISSTLEFLSTQLQCNIEAVKNERIIRLLSSLYASKEDFNMDCIDLDLELTEDRYQVSIVLFHEPIPTIADVVSMLRTFFHPISFFYAQHSFSANQLVLLYTLTDDQSISLQYLEDARKLIETTFKSTVTIGFGTLVTSTSTIADSYLQAASALEHRFIKGNSTTIGFKDIEPLQKGSPTYPHKEFELLNNAFLAQGIQEIRESIKRVIDYIDHTELPLYLVRSICFDLVHMVNAHNPTQSRDFIELSGGETAQEIIAKIKTWHDELQIQMRTGDGPTIEEMISYLDENALRCDFSVFEVAEYFGMNLSTFSKYFKSLTNQNVIDYTLTYRISAAKLLLETTDFSLKDIAEKVGYYNLSSFTRRFKSDQGITPSEYRRLKEQRRL